MVKFIKVTRNGSQKMLININEIKTIIEHSQTGTAVITVTGEKGKQVVDYHTEESFDAVFNRLNELGMI